MGFSEGIRRDSRGFQGTSNGLQMGCQGFFRGVSRRIKAFHVVSGRLCGILGVFKAASRYFKTFPGLRGFYWIFKLLRGFQRHFKAFGWLEDLELVSRGFRMLSRRFNGCFTGVDPFELDCFVTATATSLTSCTVFIYTWFHRWR